MSDLVTLERTLLEHIARAAQPGELETIRVAALGKKGSISQLLKTLGSLEPQQRREQGARINGLKERVQQAIATRRQGLKQAELEAKLNTQRLDVTLPVAPPPIELGRVHPLPR